MTGGLASTVFFSGGGAVHFAGGAAGEQLFFADATSLAAAASIDGGLGYDTLVLTGGAGVTDSAFTHVTNVNQLVLNGAGSQSATLGANAEAAFNNLIVVRAPNAAQRADAC